MLAITLVSALPRLLLIYLIPWIGIPDPFPWFWLIGENLLSALAPYLTLSFLLDPWFCIQLWF